MKLYFFFLGSSGVWSAGVQTNVRSLLHVCCLYQPSLLSELLYSRLLNS